MSARMIGVVLWADTIESKAVVWCEDQGNLAFYAAEDDLSVHDGVALDAGDLIEFDIREESDLRFVRNPALVNAAHAPTLAHNLQGVFNASDPAPRPANDTRCSTSTARSRPSTPSHLRVVGA